MAHSLEDRIYYELPLAHGDFENIRCNLCIRENNETVDQYYHSQDGLLILVKTYVAIDGLTLFDSEDPNWITPEPEIEE